MFGWLGACDFLHFLIWGSPNHLEKIRPQANYYVPDGPVLFVCCTTSSSGVLLITPNPSNAWEQEQPNPSRAVSCCRGRAASSWSLASASQKTPGRAVRACRWSRPVPWRRRGEALMGNGRASRRRGLGSTRFEPWIPVSILHNRGVKKNIVTPPNIER
jgi:hypothetical protein